MSHGKPGAFACGVYGHHSSAPVVGGVLALPVFHAESLSGPSLTPPVPLQLKKPLCVSVAKSQFEYALLSAMQYGQPMLPASRIWLSSS